METRSNRRKMTESIVDKIRRGEVSAFDALATELPDVFNAEILSKLQLEDALNLARVNKRYNDAVWSVDGVRAMKRIMGAQRIPRESLDKLGATPMYFAARHGNVPAVRALLKSGVDIDEVVLEGSYTALQTATAWQSPEVVKLLIDAGADVDKCNVDYGTPPLHLAAENGGAMIAMLLIKAGAEVNLADPQDGKTPLWFAVDSHNMQMVSMLVRSGAHVDIAPYDDDDMSPMEMAEDTKCEGMLELLRLAPSRIERRCEKTATNLSLGRPAWRVGLTWVEPRFSVGDRVECCIAVDPEEWAPGTVISHWFRFPEWPISHYAPYQIKLDDSEELIFAPEDHDNCIRLVG
jgi:ankyrin repeat protein